MSTGVSTQTAALTTVPIGVDFVGFWRRVAAFSIDAVLLGLVGAFVGWVLGNWLVGVGQWGRLIGVVIAGAYLVPANSRLFAGQTIGMRVLKTRVQTLSGELLSPERSAMRYLAFAVTYFCNGLFITLHGAPSWVQLSVGAVLGTILIVGILGNVYLLLFNRPSRRLLHDLVAGSVVVKVSSSRTAVQAPVALGHLGAFAVIVAACLCSTCSSTNRALMTLMWWAARQSGGTTKRCFRARPDSFQRSAQERRRHAF
jgi:uncharacterized RDD family membrane protein YckC